MRRYAFNAASASATRAKDFSLAALKSAFSAVIVRPAMAAYSGLQKRFQGTATGSGAGGANNGTPPVPPSPQTPSSNGSGFVTPQIP